MTTTTSAPPDDTLRRTGTTVAALAASELLGKVATFVMFLLLARVLGLAAFGVLSLGFGLGLLLAVLSSSGLDSRLIQLGSAQPELLDRCYGALVAIRAVLSAAICVVTFAVLLLVMAPSEAVTVGLVVVACLLDIFTDAARGCCGARQQQHRSAVVLVVQRFLTLALVAGALAVAPRADLAALAYVVGTLGGVVAMHLAARRAGVRLQVRGSRAEVRLLLQAVPVMGLNAFASMGLFRIDTALVGVLLGTTAVGVYSANYRIFETVTFVTWTLSRGVVPVMASRPDDLDHVRRWGQLSMLAMLAVYLPYGVLMALRGDDIVTALLGAEYADPGLLVALALAPAFFGIGHQCASLLLALHPDPMVLFASVLALVANIALNLVLIPWWGLLGAAIATTVSFAIQAVVLLVVVHQRIGSLVPPRRLLGLAVGCAAAATWCSAVSPLWPAVLAAGSAYLVATGVVSLAADPALVRDARGLRRH
ncbi:oligosaccharide flippase family protein [Nocardioides nitrophenolicus]|uniref:oligosaccharide flippase family protein n=1 Tax=Nocardioides nitrophenolicus TaxID=60489 RepID=UPI00195631BC|nr:oligosaccharide flippase family protein [Nocardioides nitrophenolicus]MBM7520320.1 O-antigen/teichoic acid export membrane protein [Nocardioides nitrophenolicus]